VTDQPVAREPLLGIPDVVDTPGQLTEALASLAQGHGPVGIDAERASGFRYGQRAYLIQVYRRDAGTWLIDPIALPDLSRLAEFLAPLEWIVHAASQDLPCLAEVGVRPTQIFDTELAGRLLGRERVSLGHLVASELGDHLEKGHGAADWSVRPLPDSWRRYAALDVEVLPDLRDHLAVELESTGKLDWALQEFDAVMNAPPAPARIQPWRRTTGLHRLRHRRSLAVAASLWHAREELAERIDTSPGRILNDSAIIEAAAAPPTSAEALGAVKGFTTAAARRHRKIWWDAICQANELAEAQLPATKLVSTDPPPARGWPGRNAAAATRLQRAKATLSPIAESVHMPLENLLSPDALRRLLWVPPTETTLAAVQQRLLDLGVRPWQCDLTAVALTEVLNTSEDPAVAD